LFQARAENGNPGPENKGFSQSALAPSSFATAIASVESSESVPIGRGSDDDANDDMAAVTVIHARSFRVSLLRQPRKRVARFGSD
jgi:hypothetical protein